VKAIGSFSELQFLMLSACARAVLRKNYNGRELQNGSGAAGVDGVFVVRGVREE